MITSRIPFAALSVAASIALATAAHADTRGSSEDNASKAGRPAASQTDRQTDRQAQNKTDSPVDATAKPALPVLVDIRIAVPSKPGKSDKAGRKSARAAARSSQRRSREARKNPSSLRLRRDRGAEMPPEPVATRANRAEKPGLARTTITRIIRSHMSEIEHCAARGAFAGEMVLRFTVAESGETDDIAIATTGRTLRSMERCMASRVRRWRFPAAPTPSPVAYPLSFTVAGR